MGVFWAYFGLDPLDSKNNLAAQQSNKPMKKTKNKQSLVAKELLDYHSELKKDKRSIFGVIEKHCESNDKYKGAYHGDEMALTLLFA